MTLVYFCLMQNIKAQKKLKNDGRKLRSIKSQNIIVDALMQLIKKGILEPTAQQVADAAGISIRTVFRQMEDMETLFFKMDEKIKHSYKKVIDSVEPKGNLQFIRSTLGIKFKYKTLQNNHQKADKDLKLLLYKWLPEMNNLDNSLQILLNSMNSVGYWIELRENQMLSAKGATKLKVNIFKNTLLEKLTK